MTTEEIKPSDTLAVVNGESSETISIQDRGLAFGDGLFETILVVENFLPLWPFHKNRLLKGLDRLNITIDYPLFHAHLTKTFQEITKLKASYVILKIMVTRGLNRVGGYSFDSNTHPNLISQIYSKPSSPLHHHPNSARVHICRQELPTNPRLAQIKSLNQLTYVMAACEREKTSYDEGLLRSNTGLLIEATARNLFIVKGKKLLSPELNECGVEGTMRQLIIEKIAPTLNIPVNISSIGLNDLIHADEVFLCNSTSGIWPVSQCDFADSASVVNTTSAKWDQGPITQALIKGVEQRIYSHSTPLTSLSLES